MTVKVTIEIEGYAALMRKLRPPENLYAKAWRDAMEEVGRLGAEQARKTAPRGATGNLVAGISYKVQKSPVPRYVVIKNTTRRKKYSYPTLLEYSPKHHHFGWMRKAIDQVMSRADQILSKAARAIERKWGS